MASSRIEFRPLQFFSASVLGILLLLAHNAAGQASYMAQLRGTVTDQSGAVMQNATVTITNDGTNISTIARTDERGLYLLTGLRPTTYTIKAEAPGFQGVENRNVVLAVDQQATLNFNLKPVSVNTTVVELAPFGLTPIPNWVPVKPLCGFGGTETSRSVSPEAGERRGREGWRGQGRRRSAKPSAI